MDLGVVVARALLVELQQGPTQSKAVEKQHAEKYSSLLKSLLKTIVDTNPTGLMELIEETLLKGTSFDVGDLGIDREH